MQEAFFGVDLMNTCKYAPLSSHDILHSGSDSDTANQSLSRPSSPAIQPPTTTATVPPAPTAGVEGVAKGVGGEGVGDALLGGGEQRQATPMSTSQHGSDGNDLGEGHKPCCHLCVRACRHAYHRV